MGELQVSGTSGEGKHSVREVPRTRTCFKNVIKNRGGSAMRTMSNTGCSSDSHDESERFAAVRL